MHKNVNFLSVYSESIHNDRRSTVVHENFTGVVVHSRNGLGSKDDRVQTVEDWTAIDSHTAVTQHNLVEIRLEPRGNDEFKDELLDV
jgi:hypothetical protein